MNSDGFRFWKIKAVPLLAGLALVSIGSSMYAEEAVSISADKENVYTEGEQNGMVEWNETWQYAEYSQIHSSSVVLYRAENSSGIVIAVNAGHGTRGGSEVQTLCHPDGSAKVTGGSTGEGAVYATAVSTGTTMLDGTPEAEVTLSLALRLKDVLLPSGYDVLMIRESSDVQLDNIARTVIANNLADCHVALHYDSTESDKGFFYIGVPDAGGYRSMQPVAEMWQEHMRLGDAILQGVSGLDNKIYGEGMIALDLTQTSYSTIPSVDVEVGDRGSDYSESTQQRLSEGIKEGLDTFFGRSSNK